MLSNYTTCRHVDVVCGSAVKRRGRLVRTAFERQHDNTVRIPQGPRRNLGNLSNLEYLTSALSF